MMTESKYRPPRTPAWVFLFEIGATVSIAGCAGAPAARTPVPVEQVVEMSKTGTPASAIIDKMEQTRSVYLLPGSSVAMLRSEGVSDDVLDYMIKTRPLAERAQADECFKWIWCNMGPPYFVVK